MPDTERSLSALQTLLADSTAGDISAQDLRDALVSALGGYGGLYCTAGVAAQTVNIAAAKLTAWTGELISSGTTPSHTSDQVTVATAANYLVSASFSSNGTAGRDFKFQLYKNGTAVTGAITQRKFASSTDVQPCGFTALVTCVASDILTVYVSADVDASALTVTEAQLVVKRVS